MGGDPEVEMANKDKGGKSDKKQAQKNLKEKRAAKKLSTGSFLPAEK